MSEEHEHLQPTTKESRVPTAWRAGLILIGLALIGFSGLWLLAAAMGDFYLDFTDPWREFYTHTSHRGWVEEHIFNPAKRSLIWGGLGFFLIVATLLAGANFRTLFAMRRARKESPPVPEKRERKRSKNWPYEYLD